MSGIKTVTYEDSLYYIGDIYEFSDGGSCWELGVLLSIDPSSAFPFTATCKWRLIREVKSKIGTITPAPIEMIEGAAYMFDYYSSKDAVGLYYNLNDMFYMADLSLKAESCTNIRLMTVEGE